MRGWYVLGIAAIAVAALSCDSSFFNTSVTGGKSPEGGAFEGFTIFLCPPYDGPGRTGEAADAKRKTEAATGWKGIYVVHEERRSGLYLGRYDTVEDAGKELERVRRWRGSTGSSPFASAYVARRAGERVGQPQWDLANAADPNWRYTVVIAEFHNLPEERFFTRKEMAVENCRELRREGKEAFYCHGPEQSFVTIGLFPRQAFRMEQLPDGGTRSVIAEERIKAIMKEKPYLAVNGYEDKMVTINPMTGRPEARITGTYVTSISDFRGGAAGPRAVGGGQPQPR